MVKESDFITKNIINEKPDLNELEAGEIMSSIVYTIQSHNTIKEAAEMILEHGVSGLPVVNEEHKLIGSVSQYDIVKYTHNKIDRLYSALKEYQNADHGYQLPENLKGLNFQDIDDTKVKDIMAKRAFAVSKTSKVSNIAKEMVRENLHRIFVTDNHGKLIGLISTTDILKYISFDY